MIVENDTASTLFPYTTLFRSSGTFTFTVSLSTAADHDVTVGYSTADGTGHPATDGSDYTGTSGTLTIAAGHTAGLHSLSEAEYSVVEYDETFFVNLANARFDG